jgi:hypothetical protein
MIRTALVLLCSFAAGFAADQNQTAPAKTVQPQPGQYKRLGSVTWDLQAHKLNWVVQKGTLTNGEFTPTSEERFEIAPDEATMGAAGEMRGFDGEEALALHQLLDTLSLYCAESVVWWDQGQGSPAELKGLPAKPSEQKPSKTTPQRAVPENQVAGRIKV